MTEPEPRSPSPDPRARSALVLHFDVNKTVLVDDKIQGIDPSTSCVQILYWASWGHVIEGGRRWVWNGEAPSLCCGDPEAVVYGDFVRGRREFKRRRWAMKRDFIKPGQPGAPLRPYFEELMAALALPEAAKAALEGQAWAREAGLHQGRVRLLPSFFALLRHLQGEGRAVSLVFRTYGSDIPEIAVELNAFCEGRHPLHPEVRMDGGGEGADMRLDLDDPTRFGAIHRGGHGGDEADAVLLALGTLENPEGRDRPPYPCPRSFFEARAHRAITAPGDFRAHLGQGAGTIGLRDDYAYWARGRFASLAGKPMFIDPADTKVHEIFFDDNVFAEDPRIVDVRDLASGRPLPLSQTRDRHLVRVSPYNAVLEERYFIERLALCERNRRA